MGRKLKVLKPVTTEEENKEYLRQLFAVLKGMESLMDLGGKHDLNTTEIRLISEIIFAGVEGRRLISTQLATRLGVTRSAISQMVNTLESRGVVCRVADEVDKKIAYIELTEWAQAHFKEDIACYTDFVAQLVARFGEARLKKMISLMTDFVKTVEILKAVEK